MTSIISLLGKTEHPVLKFPYHVEFSYLYCIDDVSSSLVLIIVVTIFFLSSVSGQESFQDQADIMIPGDKDRSSDTLVQELKPWVDEEGRSVRRFRLTNTRGLALSVMSWGAAITGLELPDGEDIVLGHDTIQEYQGPDNPYLGATVGRVANRIRGGQFRLGGRTHNLTINNAGNTLHGGTQGWDKSNWKAEVRRNQVVFR